MSLVEDTERHRLAWERRLADAGIDPSLYLWERCATAFPGVRRFVGATEQAQLHRRVAFDPASLTDALQINDNSYPKEIWSFVLRGGRANRQGPPGYSLAHLADHKHYKSRLSEEFLGVAGLGDAGLPGLFTSAANTVYVPDQFLRPTDTTSPLRTLLQRRAMSLYGEFCNLVPPGMSLRPAASPEWQVGSFTWGEPVGALDQVDSFLAFRREHMEELFALRIRSAGTTHP